MDKYRKFLVALAAGIGVLITALADGEVIASEWCAIALGVLGALGVYQIPNEPMPGAPAGEPADPDADAGGVDVGMVIVVALVIVLILVLLRRV